MSPAAIDSHAYGDARGRSRSQRSVSRASRLVLNFHARKLTVVQNVQYSLGLIKFAPSHASRASLTGGPKKKLGESFAVERCHSFDHGDGFDDGKSRRFSCSGQSYLGRIV
jgi:hypothetical protein